MASHSRSQSTVAYATAAALVDRAMSHAREKGWSIAAVVVDPSGHLVAAGRMDGVAPPILDYANDKAFTATLGNSSRAFFERMSSSPDLQMGMVNRPRVCAWEGGVPIYEDRVLIGGLGVSGSAGPDDVACAEVALASLGLHSDDEA